MTETELELTYLVRELPGGLAQCPSALLVDVYYPASGPHPTLRLRQKGDSYEITKKVTASGTDSSHMLEHTIRLSREEFEALGAAPGRRVTKRRYEYSYQGRVAEVDVFEGGLRGLVVVDFEFTDRDEQMAFRMPEFCLVDVTQEELTAGGMLAGKSYSDIATQLEQLGYKPLTLKEES